MVAESASRYLVNQSCDISPKSHQAWKVQQRQTVLYSWGCARNGLKVNSNPMNWTKFSAKKTS